MQGHRHPEQRCRRQGLRHKRVLRRLNKPLSTWTPPSSPDPSVPGHPALPWHLLTSSIETRGRATGWRAGGLPSSPQPLGLPCQVPRRLHAVGRLLPATIQPSFLWKQGCSNWTPACGRKVQGTSLGVPALSSWPISWGDRGGGPGYSPTSTTEPITELPRKSSDLHSGFRQVPSCSRSLGEGGLWVWATLLLTQPSSPRSSPKNRAHQRRMETRQTLGQPRGGVRSVLHQPLHSGPRPALPGEGSARRSRKWLCTSPLAGHRARAAGTSPAWRKRAQERQRAGCGRSRALHFVHRPPTFTFCPEPLCWASQAEQSIYRSPRTQSSLPKHT